MNDALLKSFIDRYNKDKEEINRKFGELSSKLEKIDCKFEGFDNKMVEINKRLEGIENMQGFGGKLDNVRVYLSTIETKLNEYKTLSMSGQKVVNGELYMLKVKLHKIKPIINWENDKTLAERFSEIEEEFLMLEEKAGKAAG